MVKLTQSAGASNCDDHMQLFWRRSADVINPKKNRPLTHVRRSNARMPVVAAIPGGGIQ